MIKFSQYLLVGAISCMVFVAGCQNNQDTGTLIGAGTGAAIGSLFGNGTGQLVAVGLGAVGGALIGGKIGQNMDETDKLKTQQTLESTPDHKSTQWKDPNKEVTYTVTPTHTYQKSSGQYCREYLTTAIIDGKEQKMYGTACRQPDGSWKEVRTQN